MSCFIPLLSQLRVATLYCIGRIMRSMHKLTYDQERGSNLNPVVLVVPILFLSEPKQSPVENAVLIRNPTKMVETHFYSRKGQKTMN